MILFKTFLKVLNKSKTPILIYTIFLIFFGGFNMTTSDKETNFTATKPDIIIINEDEEKGITQNFIEYLEAKSNVKEIEQTESAINDAIFYRDVNYVIYIPKNFREDFLNHKNPKIEVKSTKDYMASLAQMLVERYYKVANIYNELGMKEEEILKEINNTLEDTLEVAMTTKLDTTSLEKASTFYNFTNYCLLAGSIYVICLILSSFKSEHIRKRTIISSMKSSEYNRKLLLSNSVFAFTLWLFYVLLSFILVGKIMFTTHGLLLILNSFVFTFCTLTIAFLLGNLGINKNAVNGIVNVIALGSSFLCGAFVPMEFLPDIVLKFAHILPSYYFIKTNELVKNSEVWNQSTLNPIFINIGIILLFSLGFILLTNRISSKKRKIA